MFNEFFYQIEDYLAVWMGIGESSNITLIAVGSFWSILLNIIRGIQNTDKKLLEVGKVLEKKLTNMHFKMAKVQYGKRIWLYLYVNFSII